MKKIKRFDGVNTKLCNGKIKKFNISRNVKFSILFNQKLVAIFLYSSSICALVFPLVSIWNLKLMNIDRKAQILKIKNMIELLQSVEHPMIAKPAIPQLIALTM